MEDKQIAMAETFLIKVRGSLDHADLMKWRYEGQLNGLSSAPAVRRNLRGGVRRSTDDRFLDVISEAERLIEGISFHIFLFINGSAAPFIS